MAGAGPPPVYVHVPPKSGELERYVERSTIGSSVHIVIGVNGADPALGREEKLTVWLAFVIGISQLFGSDASTKDVILNVALGTADEVTGHKFIGLPVAILFPAGSIVNV